MLLFILLFCYDQNSTSFCQYSGGEVLRDIQGASTSSLLGPGALLPLRAFPSLTLLSASCFSILFSSLLSAHVAFCPSLKMFSQRCHHCGWGSQLWLAAGPFWTVLGMEQPLPVLTEAALLLPSPAPGHGHPLQSLSVWPCFALPAPLPLHSLITWGKGGNIHHHGHAA